MTTLFMNLTVSHSPRPCITTALHCTALVAGLKAGVAVCVRFLQTAFPALHDTLFGSFSAAHPKIDPVKEVMISWTSHSVLSLTAKGASYSTVLLFSFLFFDHLIVNSTLPSYLHFFSCLLFSSSPYFSSHSTQSLLFPFAAAPLESHPSIYIYEWDDQFQPQGTCHYTLTHTHTHTQQAQCHTTNRL